MGAYVVARRYGRYGVDYLASWDIIWGPVWTGSRAAALTFATHARATDAAHTAVAIMAPKPWCVPDFGRARVEIEG